MSVKSVKVNDFENCLTSYFNDIKSFKPLNKKEEKILWKRFKEDNDMSARTKLINANLKFVSDVAKNYRGCGLPYADIISEGNAGLVKAIDKFDPKRDNKVISYARWWIKKFIIEAIERRGVIDAENLEENTGEKPVEKDSNDDIYRNSNGDTYSVNEYLNRGSSNNTKKQIINELFDGISEREKYIVCDYFGVNGSKPKTLDEIGEELNLTKERVRQLNEKALKKMRTNALEKDITFF